MPPDDPHGPERDVRSADPTLTQQANELLTTELREAVGHDRVPVAADAPDHRRDRNATHSPLLAPFVEMRLALLVAVLVAALVLGVIGIAAGGAWVVVGVFVALLLGIGAVIGLVAKMTAEQEHVSPETAARLEDEGVANPDHAFNELVEEFSAPDDGDDDDRTTSAEQRPATATAEQRTAMTPTSGPSAPTGPGDDG